ncbi:MAG: decarboxylating 6-phosphogluconate dehydrogenase [Parachlamydiales bacterium]|nr:decarboxylating 6-phosphogluconate dehydrogenase [Parachlamydiales bacterium]
MKIGFVGLGKMGQNMTKRLLSSHEVVVFDINEKALKEAKSSGAIISSSIKDLISKLPDQKVIWMMVPQGDITKNTILEISKFLKKGDILIDGGNSYYKDSQISADELLKKGINFLDIGTSGGIFGLKEGYCLMVGGDEKAYTQIEPILKSLAAKDGYQYVGNTGSGHYTKMVHNAIEYGIMQAYAEGFELLKEKKEFDLDMKKISKLWNHSSVIRSWLLELVENIFEKDQNLSEIKGFVQDSGEGRWSVKEAVDLGVSVNVIAASLFERFSSRKPDSFKAKILAALRDQFGGHGVFRKDKEL